MSSCCRLCHCLLSLGCVVYHPTTPLLLLLKSLCSYSSADASVVVVDSLGPLLRPRHLRCCLQSLGRVIYSSRLPLPTPSLSSSITWDCKHTAASAVGDVHSDALYLLLPPMTPPLSSSIPQAHLPLPTLTLLSPSPHGRYRNAVAFVIIPESLGTSSLLRSPLALPASLLIFWDHLPPQTPLLSSITRASQREIALSMNHVREDRKSVADMVHR